MLPSHDGQFPLELRAKANIFLWKLPGHVFLVLFLLLFGFFFCFLLVFLITATEE